jgi:transcriptional regulator with XRE-family HTH domain
LKSTKPSLSSILAPNKKLIQAEIMNTGKIISDLRDQKKWSQGDLAKHSDISKVMIGKYERDEATPSLEAAKKIADALGVTLDHLVGEGVNADFDKKDLQRFKELLKLEDDKKKTLFDLIDTYIRDFKTRQAHKSV